MGMTNKTMPPLISVIIPVYNHAHTLKRCLLSILNQTHQSLEVIIVNDGSTDNFDEVAASCHPEIISGKHSIKVINQENKGAPAARNRGFADSKGEYVIFWDADTLAHPQMLEKMLNALQTHPQASYAYSQFKFGWNKMKSQPFDADKLKKINYIDVTSLIRRESLNCHPERSEGSLSTCPFDVSIKRFQDWDMWLSMLERGKTGVFVPELLYKKIVFGRTGISNWSPSFVYKLPWKIAKVKKYETAKEIILKKHHLS